MEGKQLDLFLIVADHDVTKLTLVRELTIYEFFTSLDKQIKITNARNNNAVQV